MEHAEQDQSAHTRKHVSSYLDVVKHCGKRHIQKGDTHHITRDFFEKPIYLYDNPEARFRGLENIGSGYLYSTLKWMPVLSLSMTVVLDHA